MFVHTQDMAVNVLRDGSRVGSREGACEAPSLQDNDIHSAYTLLNNQEIVLTEPQMHATLILQYIPQQNMSKYAFPCFHLTCT